MKDEKEEEEALEPLAKRIKVQKLKEALHLQTPDERAVSKLQSIGLRSNDYVLELLVIQLSFV